MSYEIEQKKAQKNLEKLVSEAIGYADLFVSKNYLINLGDHEVKQIEKREKTFRDLGFVEITKLCFDPKENVQEKLKTVYTALFNIQSSVLLMLVSDKKGVRFLLGYRNEKQPVLAGNILQKTLQGNFPGMDLKPICGHETERMMEAAFPSEYDTKSIASVSIVPGERSRADSFVQGIEKFIDTMAGEDYTALFIADPLSQEILENKKRGFEKLYSALSTYSTYSLAYGENKSQAVSKSLTEGLTESINESVSDTFGSSSSRSSGTSKGSYHGNGFNILAINYTYGKNSGTTEMTAQGDTNSHTQTSGKSTAKTENKTEGNTDTQGSSVTITTTQQNKTIQEIQGKIEEQLKRIRASETYGLYDLSCYFSSSDKLVTLTAANTFKALVSGEQTSVENSFINFWDDSRAAWTDGTARVCDYLRYGKHVQVNYRGKMTDQDGKEIMAEQTVTPANMVSGMELPLVMGFPMKSVNGVSVIASAEFGRSVRYRPDVQKRTYHRYCDMGAVLHMGKIWPENRVKIDLDSLTGHCFLTGTTGAGKSNTNYKFLEELLHQGIPFLVVEPAKGEYKKQFGNVSGIHVFTTSSRFFEMLHLNPFAFPRGIHVAEHLQTLVQVCSACWPLYAAMPAILKEGFEAAYRYCGWDIHHSVHFDNGHGMYPDFKILLKLLPEIIEASAYSADTKGDYQGALVKRVQSLTDGLVGDIFCDGKPVDDHVLFEENTIIDLSRLKDDETVSLIMGVLIMKLQEYRTAQELPENSPLRHVTVLEEAHNILKKVSLDQDSEAANVQGAAVSMIRRSIAEMRTYGEGFVILDQSPSEVDVAAIRNTNTKFIMKLSDQDDFEMVGHTIGLKEEQILEIGRLPRGAAVIYQTEWEEPVLTMIDAAHSTYVLKKLPENDRNAQQELLGAVIHELMEQHDMGEYNMAWINSILNREKRVSHDKKQFYHMHLSNFIREITGRNEKEKELRFARLLYALIRCEDQFRIFKPEIPVIKKHSEATPQIQQKVKRWAQQIMANLDHYCRLEENEKEKVFEYLLLQYIIETNDVRGKIAISILYPQQQKQG